MRIGVSPALSCPPRARLVVAAPSSPCCRARVIDADVVIASTWSQVVSVPTTPSRRRPGAASLPARRLRRRLSPLSLVCGRREDGGYGCLRPEAPIAFPDSLPLALAIRGFCLSPGTDTVPLAAKKDRASSALFVWSCGVLLLRRGGLLRVSFAVSAISP